MKYSVKVPILAGKVLEETGRRTRKIKSTSLTGTLQVLQGGMARRPVPARDPLQF